MRRQQVVRVCATAGAGKTTSVADAVRALDEPVAWLTVDKSEVAPGRFVTYLESALARVDPSVSGLATSALNSGLSHVEAAGLLSERAGERAIVLVLDDLERLSDAPEPWAVIEALVRYAPRRMRFIMLSRGDVPAANCAFPAHTGIGIVGDSDLAFTEAEASDALRRREAPEIDAAIAVDATGGWVTGVLFEAWRSAHHVRGSGGEADPLHGYLSSHILGGLDPDEREFLIVTSVLDEVTAGRAEALGVKDAGQVMGRLAVARLPVSWSSSGDAMRCQRRFREYLSTLLAPRGVVEVRRLRLLHGRHLIAEGHAEEAVEKLLEAEAPVEAIEPAGRVIFEVIERLDFPVAHRWLEALRPVSPPGPGPLTTAELMLCVAQDDFTRAVAVADHLAEVGQRETLASGFTKAAALMGWCYTHVARLDDALKVLDAAGPSPELDVVSYCASLLIDFPERSRPEAFAPTGGPLDSLPLAANYFRGRLNDVVEVAASPWAEALSRPYRIGVLKARGQTTEAVRLYESAKASTGDVGLLGAAIGPELLIDAGDLDAAASALDRGRELALASGSLLFEALNVVAAMTLAVSRVSEPVETLRILDRLEAGSPLRRFQYTAELRDTWFGLALLRAGADTDALFRLRRATHGMIGAGRTLDLPCAAVYLAEAHWRAGDEDAAEQAAGTALEAARRQGSNHQLLRALREFPSVLSRQIDAQRDPDSEWHELGRALLTHHGPATTAPARVRLADLGGPRIEIDGVAVRPGLAKSYEVLAYLCVHGGAVDRVAMLNAVFDGNAGKSSRAYLRQALRRLNEAIPDPPVVAITPDRVELPTQVTCDSVRVERAISSAAVLKGKARLEGLLHALAEYDRGPFLPGADTAWVEDRRDHLVKLAVDARYEAAEIAYGLGRLTEARQLVDRVLRDDAFREAGWRLSMRVAHALGDDAGVLAAYRSCAEVLSQLEITPAPATRRLFEGLRR